MINKFPTIDNVHETLSDLTKLFEDRNKILQVYFKEDKYKDFLMAENVQQLVEADKRDDSREGRIKKDLANGYEVLKAKTNMQKFANFITPGMLPTLDLSDSADFEELLDEIEGRETVEPEQSDPPPLNVMKGDKGEKGDPGDTVVQPQRVSGFDHIALPGTSQNSGLNLAEGGVVPPSPMMNAMNPSAQRPETKSGVKSLESLGLVGKKNVASELTEDLGLEDYKKALADAMALPLKAVAAGLAGLLDNIDVPGGETAAIEGQVSKVGKTFGVKTKKKKKENKLMNFVQGGGIVGALGRMFGGGKKKKKGPQTYDEAMAESDAYAAEVQRIVDPYGSDDTMEDYEPKGGPSLVRSAPGYLGIGGASHEPVAPDTLSTSGDTKIDAMRNSITNITQGAKNMMAKTPMVRGIKAASGVISKLLGNVQPASEGSQYNSQDINTLTNQVMMDNEQIFNQQTDIALGAMGDSSEEGTKAIMAAIAKMGNTPMGIGEEDPLPPAPLKPSKHLIHSISIVDGGQTPNDVV